MHKKHSDPRIHHAFRASSSAPDSSSSLKSVFVRLRSESGRVAPEMAARVALSGLSDDLVLDAITSRERAGSSKGDGSSSAMLWGAGK